MAKFSLKCVRIIKIIIFQKLYSSIILVSNRSKNIGNILSVNTACIELWLYAKKLFRLGYVILG